MGLVTLSDVNRYFLSSYDSNPSVLDAETERIEFLIEAVSSQVETICGRKFLEADHTEVYDGNGTNSIFLNQYPVNSITSIKYGTPFNSNTRDTISSEDYVFYSSFGEVTFNFCNIDHPQMFEVEYNAGYSEIPYDLNLYILKQIAKELNKTSQDTTIKSEKLGDAAYTYVLSSEEKNIMTVELGELGYIRQDV